VKYQVGDRVELKGLIYKIDGYTGTIIKITGGVFLPRIYHVQLDKLHMGSGIYHAGRGQLLRKLEVLPHEDQMTTCRFCGEDIKTIAVKCKHCGSNLSSIKP
jgi:hypothetical protein